ncbi:hypothetical protein CK203_060859 [Vitis vinifera]|uniref:Uncharacterized protein n=1 Tax=Vitis vinifera TaxID=29760 RepID=A0A438FUB9_VITVI|nr:hypothetical protein CK203_060859 [Vitis vinifera]
MSADANENAMGMKGKELAAVKINAADIDIIANDRMWARSYCCSVGSSASDDDPFSKCGYGVTIVETDIIEHALQEELSRLAVDEAARFSHEVAEDLQVSILPKGWPYQSMENYGFGHESGQEDIDGMGLSSSCSSPDEKSHNGEGWLYSLDLTDEHALDVEVGTLLQK